ncbi:MAG: hypothetical protein AB7H71_08870 [Alphaproteobacteria bacterium]
MEVREAVALAKRYVGELFVDEPIGELGLEEVEFDESSGTWLITIGFLRNWSRGGIEAFAPKKRDYKVVRILDADKKMISVKNREPAD